MTEKWENKLKELYNNQIPILTLYNDNSINDFMVIDATVRIEDFVRKEISEARKDAVMEAIEQIELILPLAKGYAAQHDVGSNMKYVKSVETYIEGMKALKKHGIEEK